MISDSSYAGPSRIGDTTKMCRVCRTDINRTQASESIEIDPPLGLQRGIVKVIATGLTFRIACSFVCLALFACLWAVPLWRFFMGFVCEGFFSYYCIWYRKTITTTLPNCVCEIPLVWICSPFRIRMPLAIVPIQRLQSGTLGWKFPSYNKTQCLQNLNLLTVRIAVAMPAVADWLILIRGSAHLAESSVLGCQRCVIHTTNWLVKLFAQRAMNDSFSPMSYHCWKS